MTKRPLKVLIIGAGTGGLCLAQGLKSNNIAVEVFERDHSPSDRLQGYRLSINRAGSQALASCLPRALFEKLVNNSANPSQAVTFLDHRLNRLLAITFARNAGDSVNHQLPVSRIALRRILLEGLDPIIHFGKKFIAFEDAPDGSVTARFEDGSTATGDVLIGAAGASSRESEVIRHANEALEIRDPHCLFFFTRYVPVITARLYADPHFREIIARMGRSDWLQD